MQEIIETIAGLSVYLILGYSYSYGRNDRENKIEFLTTIWAWPLVVLFDLGQNTSPKTAGSALQKEFFIFKKIKDTINKM